MLSVAPNDTATPTAAPQVLPEAWGVSLAVVRGASTNSADSRVTRRIVVETSSALRLQQQRRKRQMICAYFTLVGVGSIMVAMMIVAGRRAQGTRTLARSVGEEWAQAPAWVMVFPMLAGMAIISVALSFLLDYHPFARNLRGVLEYTTVLLLDIEHGRTYNYRFQPKSAKGQTAEELMERELHQLKVEAGLAGWSDAALQSQLDMLFEAHTQNAVSGDTTLAIEAIKAHSGALAGMLLRTLDAMPLPIRVANVILALFVIVFGALGTFLTVGIASMPEPDLDALWADLSFQVVNLVFSLICIWKGPQRFKLLRALVRHECELIVDGEVRSLLAPGVLLKRSQMLTVAILRAVNICMQYVNNFFMWGYFVRCVQEEAELGTECKTRPPWATPLFMVLGMFSDVASNVAMSQYIKKCPYIKWPVVEASEQATNSSKVTAEDSGLQTADSHGLESLPPGVMQTGGH
eukprot:TRINITY_DN75034_c0_g1_i1.p1 TRINITY_DN75034_c0_g1~~TRINITY_DN75034_c0_g1_i1.p1  ORF type:complete len:464 (+),score=58.61 TRINITY_DN75034_c0_g1_i1:53-1444(+)